MSLLVTFFTSNKKIAIAVVFVAITIALSITAFATQPSNIISKKVISISSTSQFLISSAINSASIATELFIHNPATVISSSSILIDTPLPNVYTASSKSIYDEPQKVVKAETTDSVSTAATIQNIVKEIVVPITSQTLVKPTRLTVQSIASTQQTVPAQPAQVNVPAVVNMPQPSPTPNPIQSSLITVDIEQLPSSGVGAVSVRTGREKATIDTPVTARTGCGESTGITVTIPCTSLLRSSCNACPIELQNDTPPPAGNIRTGGGCCK